MLTKQLSDFLYSLTYQDLPAQAVDCAKMCVEDGSDDPEIVYTKEKVDRALRAACGDGILPFDKRYAPENLYFRDKLNASSEASYAE